MAKKPGSNPGRLTTLYAFHQWLASLKKKPNVPKQKPNDDTDSSQPKKEKGNEPDGNDA